MFASPRASLSVNGTVTEMTRRYEGLLRERLNIDIRESVHNWSDSKYDSYYGNKRSGTKSVALTTNKPGRPLSKGENLRKYGRLMDETVNQEIGVESNQL